MPPLMLELEIILGAALAVVVLFRRFNLPSIAGFLLAGILIGPSGLGLIANPEKVADVAEIGVVLLLFTIGLDLSIQRLASSWRSLLAAGGGQLALTTLAAAAVLGALGVGREEATLLGLAVALSSTAIVLKALAERGEVGAPHGRLAVGILVVQDVAVIPALVVLPLLAGGAAGGGASAVALALVKALGGMAAVLLAGRYLVPRLFAQAVKVRSREVFTLLVIVLLLGVAGLASRFGLSLAMGAFLAGLMLAESEYGPQALAEVFPVKETFSGVFFTSLGMLLDLRYVGPRLGTVLALALALVVAKTLLTALACRLVQPSWRIALTTGLALSQVGEFALVLGAAGLVEHVLDPGRHQLLLAVTVATMLASPFLVATAHGFVLGVFRRFGPAGYGEDVPSAVGARCLLTGHVVIVGYGLNGTNLARVLTATHVPFVAVDMNPALVEQGRLAGHAVSYGDATTAEVLDAVEVSCARVLVVAISDPLATRQVVSVARRINPGIQIIVKTRFMGEIEELRRLGATDVVAEEFETSVEIFTRVLRELLVPRNVIAIQVDLIRREGYGMLRGLRMPSRMADQLTHILAASAVDNVQVLEGSPALGRTLKELDLRGRTGTTLVAVIREGKAHTNPSPDWLFEEGDILILIGGHAQVDEADRLLSPPPQEQPG